MLEGSIAFTLSGATELKKLGFGSLAKMGLLINLWINWFWETQNIGMFTCGITKLIIRRMVRWKSV